MSRTPTHEHVGEHVSEHVSESVSAQAGEPTREHPPRPPRAQKRNARLLALLPWAVALWPLLLALVFSAGAVLVARVLPGTASQGSVMGSAWVWAAVVGLAACGAAAAAGLRQWLVKPMLKQLREADQLLLTQGQHDGLTGALTRDGLHRSLQSALVRYKKRPKSVAVVMIDFDRFRLINDTLGQQAGDEVLCLAADRIRSVMRSRDVLARLGADRYAVQVTGAAGEPVLQVLARNLLRAFGTPCPVAGREMTLSPSLGTAIAEGENPTADELLACAELALRAAKQAGGSGFRHFDPSLKVQHHLRMDMENRLRQAALGGAPHTLAARLGNRHVPAFALAYQPIVDAQSECVVGVEALLRWPEEGRPQTSPAEFVPVLEQTGLIVPVGRWVLIEACRQALKWLSQGAHGLVLSVNVSPRQFAEPDFAASVGVVLALTGFPANRLQLEVTEGLLLDPTAETLGKLDALVKTGVRLAVDDFGIGHSSLVYLKTFPLHTLKIDRMFVRDLQAQGQHQTREHAIVRAVIELGHSLGLSVTAEGVETAEQAQSLRDMGCDALQGYRFGRPVPADMFKQLLALKAAPDTGALPHSGWSDTMAGLEQHA